MFLSRGLIGAFVKFPNSAGEDPRIENCNCELPQPTHGRLANDLSGTVLRDTFPSGFDPPHDSSM